jgi:hypothetical protein
MCRRNLPRVVILAFLVGLGCQGVAVAATRLDVATIKAGLQTVDKEENGFVERVVARMDEGTLSRKTVETAFLWAKQKPRRKFQFFRQALIILAAREGVKVS